MTPAAKRKALQLMMRLVCVSVTVAGLYFAFAKLNLHDLRQAFAGLRPAWFLAGILFFGFACLVGAVRLHLMLRLTQTAVHFGASLRTVMIGHFFYTIFLGAAGGDLAKTAVYKRWFRLPLPEIVVAFSLDRFLGLAGLVFFGALAFGLAAANGASARLGASRLTIPRWSLWAATALAMLGLVILWKWRPRGDSLVAKTRRALVDSARQLRVRPRLAAAGVISALIVQSALACVLALNLRAVASTAIPWREIVWVFPLLFALTALPVSIGGLGVRESAAVTLLGIFGVPGPDAFAASVLTFFAGLVWSCVGAWVFLREETLQSAQPALPITISVVIPTLNEAENLPATVNRVLALPEVKEIIVVDGGSADPTVEMARQLGCRVFLHQASRGAQLHLGASHASGDVILLLHADTWIPSTAGQAIFNALRDSHTVAGGFWKVFRNPTFLLKGSRWKCALRLYAGRRVAADQAIFVRRDKLAEIGGIPDLPLMEEFELCRRLRKIGRLVLVDATVETSARRFISRGVLRTYALMWWITIKYHLGTPPEELRRLYEKK